jgi:hypothetical protein
MQRLSRLRCYGTLHYTTLCSEVDQRFFSSPIYLERLWVFLSLPLNGHQDVPSGVKRSESHFDHVTVKYWISKWLEIHLYSIITLWDVHKESYSFPVFFLPPNWEVCACLYCTRPWSLDRTTRRHSKQRDLVASYYALQLVDTRRIVFFLRIFETWWWPRTRAETCRLYIKVFTTYSCVLTLPFSTMYILYTTDNSHLKMANVCKLCNTLFSLRLCFIHFLDECLTKYAYVLCRAWKAIGNRFLKPCYLSRGDHNRKIRTRKKRTDVGKYSFVNRNIKS